MKPGDNPKILRVTVGRGLWHLIDTSGESPLVKCVVPIRSAISERFGLVIPGIFFTDDANLEPTEYRFFHRQQLLAQATLEPNCSLLVSASALAVKPQEPPNHSLQGDNLVSPPSLLPKEESSDRNRLHPAVAALFPCRSCGWISDLKIHGLGQSSDIAILSHFQIIERHLRQVLIDYSPHLLSFEDVSTMLERSPLTATKAALKARGYDSVEIWKLFRILLQKRISIGHIDQRLEQILFHLRPEDKNDVVKLAERLQSEFKQQPAAASGLVRYN